MIFNQFSRRQRGATLMEVLITMVIMLFGLIGLSQLFVRAQNTTAEAYDRHRALALANYMAEAMRSMMRIKPTDGAAGASANACPADSAIPSTGVLSNEQIMACFVAGSRPQNLPIGRFFNETTTANPPVLRAALGDCERDGGNCNNKKMVNYMLNVWSEALSGQRQTAISSAGTTVTSNRTFAGRGCVQQLCDQDGTTAGTTGCGANDFRGIYRVYVLWHADEPLAADDARFYCGLPAPYEFTRYTFVDISLPAPSAINR